VRAAVLSPWAMPTVVAALVWRFLFESPVGIAGQMLIQLGITDTPFVWFGDNVAAWVPIVLADVWKTTPFVALLLLAGLQTIDRSLYQAARLDGANSWQQFRYITLPLLRPGGPGTATEPIALYTFNIFFQKLRFGFGAALSVVIFSCTFVLALLYIRVLGKGLTGESA
jgi:multiple sugar transport system permease protein